MPPSSRSQLSALDRMGMEMESVAQIGHYLLLTVEDYLAGSYVEPSGPQRT
jgi:hypothetical protein